MARQAGQAALTPEQVTDFEGRYQASLTEGYEANPPAERGSLPRSGAKPNKVQPEIYWTAYPVINRRSWPLCTISRCPLTTIRRNGTCA